MIFSCLQYLHLLSWKLVSLVILCFNLTVWFLWILLWILALTLAVLFPFILYFLGLKINYVKDLSDVGYSFKDSHGSTYNRYGKSKRQLANEMRRSRKVGNLPPIYPNGWFALLESDELKRKQAKYVSALGENFAVFRSESGQVHVLDAYCSHLGANMAIGGFVRGDCIECPFHQWQFSGKDGRCVNIPYSEKVPEMARVRHWESIEVNGLVMVWYHAENEKPSWRPEPIGEIENGQWLFRGRSEFLINCHLQDITENAADIAHLRVLHGPSLLAGNNLCNLETAAANTMRHVTEATWEPHPTPESHISTMRVRQELRLFNSLVLPFLEVNVEVKMVGPGYNKVNLTTRIGQLVIIDASTPIEPMLQKKLQRIYCPPYLCLIANILFYAACTMVERDIMVWNHKTYLEKPLLVKEDKALARCRRWYSQFYTENSPRLDYKKDSLEW